jgi:hypothetical protein
VATGGHADDDELRRQDVELYQELTLVLAGPAGTTVTEALRSGEGHRVRRKWELKYGRGAPLEPLL